MEEVEDVEYVLGGIGDVGCALVYISRILQINVQIYDPFSDLKILFVDFVALKKTPNSSNYVLLILSILYDGLKENNRLWE